MQRGQKNRGNTSSPFDNVQGSTKVYLLAVGGLRVFDLVVLISLPWLIREGARNDDGWSAAGRMLGRLQEKAFWFMEVPCSRRAHPSVVRNANINTTGALQFTHLISNCRYVFPGNRGEATETLTFVYALPPLSSCRENRKRAMKPADPTLYYRGASITGSWNYRLRTQLWLGTMAFTWETWRRVCLKISRMNF